MSRIKQSVRYRFLHDQVQIDYFLHFISSFLPFQHTKFQAELSCVSFGLSVSLELALGVDVDVDVDEDELPSCFVASSSTVLSVASVAVFVFIVISSLGVVPVT